MDQMDLELKRVCQGFSNIEIGLDFCFNSGVSLVLFGVLGIYRNAIK